MFQQNVDRLQQSLNAAMLHQAEKRRKLIEDAIEENGRAFAAFFSAAFEAKQFAKKRIALQPPGTFLIKVADFACSKRTVTFIVQPNIADMQFECFEAFCEGRKYKATWIRIRESIRLVFLLAAYTVLEMMVGLFSHPRTPQ
jgi:hypothetical protein